MTSDDLVVKHLESIGSQGSLSALKSRVAQGTVAFNERISDGAQLQGAAQFLSIGPKVKCAFQFKNLQYPGEQFVFDGKTVQVALIDPQSRSALGSFLLNEPEILQEGLLGGTLSMGWPLLDAKRSGARLKFEGLKKIEGQDLYDLIYFPKKRGSAGELSIHLYFEPDDFRHVMTIYRLSTTSMGTSEGDPQAGDSGIQTRTLIELFSNFHAVDGVTLPSQWEIRFRVEPGRAQEFQWKIALNSVAHDTF